jgi:hypothetical protein
VANPDSLERGHASTKKGAFTARGEAQCVAFLKGLHSPAISDLIELRAFSPDDPASHPKPRAFIHNLKGILEFVAANPGLNHYYGVATRKSTANGTLENCSTLTALFADVDLKREEHPAGVTVEEFWKLIQNFPHPPSAIIWSGHGWHAYWFLRDRLILDADGKAIGKRILQTLCKAVQGDPASAECARVLRLPGTFNCKDKPPVEVELVTFDADVRYTIEEFRDLFAQQWQREDAALAAKAVSEAKRVKRPISTMPNISRIEAALDAIGADDYKVWVDCGMALKAELSEAGLEIWKSWSATSSKYDEAVVDYKWRTFTAGGGVKIGTLFQYAKGVGADLRGAPNLNGNSHLRIGRQTQLVAGPPREDVPAPEPASVASLHADAHPSPTGPPSATAKPTDRKKSEKKPEIPGRREPPGGTSNEHFRFLGKSSANDDSYYYFPWRKSQVVQLSVREHTNTARLYDLAPLSLWEQRFVKRGGGFDKESAADWLIQISKGLPVYDPSRARGRGAWMDQDRPGLILHLGDRIYHGGKESSISDFHSDAFQYSETAPLKIDLSATPLTPDQGAKVAGVCRKFLWRNPLSAELLLGWIVIAPLCGPLKWRPHIWLTGPAGAGKTTIVSDFVNPLMPFRFPVAFTGGTTEAGIRQQVHLDAMACTYDEAESDDPGVQSRIAGLLTLLRASSSSAFRLAKGNTSGKGMLFEMSSVSYFHPSFHK